jgi:hypothetical protein
MSVEGYGIWWRGVYCCALTTGRPRDDGRHELILSAVGADTHEHIWLQCSDEAVARMGTRLKNRGEAGGPATEVNALSTSVIARVRLTWDENGNKVATEVRDVFSAQEYAAATVATARGTSAHERVRIDVNVPEEARVVVCAVAISRPDTLPLLSSVGTRIAQLKFSPGSPFGLAMVIERWSTGSEE